MNIHSLFRYGCLSRLDSLHQGHGCFVRFLVFFFLMKFSFSWAPVMTSMICCSKSFQFLKAPLTGMELHCGTKRTLRSISVCTCVYVCPSIELVSESAPLTFKKHFKSCLIENFPIISRCGFIYHLMLKIVNIFFIFLKNNYQGLL